MTLTPDEFSQGEIGRTLFRLEQSVTELRSEVRAITEPVSTLKVQMSNAELSLSKMDTEVRAVTKDANRIAGAGAILAVLAGIIPFPWKIR